MFSFTEDEIQRYSRHILLQEVGGKGQQRLKDSKVLVVGAGGLGSPSAYYLAAAGVGTIGIIDDDVVELSNLQRQILHDTANVGKPKAESAAERLRLSIRVSRSGSLRSALTRTTSWIWCGNTMLSLTESIISRPATWSTTLACLRARRCRRRHLALGWPLPDRQTG